MNPKYDWLKSILTPVAYQPLFRYGGKSDGGYVLAEDLTEKSEIVYSYGIGEHAENVLFDRDLARRGKKIHQYDGTIERTPLQCDGVYFIRENARSNNILSHIRTNNHDGNTNMTLKMDIEGGEYETLGNCPLSVFDHYVQIALEVHDLIHEGWVTNPMSPANKINDAAKEHLLRRLLSRYHLVHLHGNNCAAFVHGMPDVLELLFIRKDVMPAKPEIARFACPQLYLDYPNRSDIEDHAFSWWLDNT